MAARAPDPTSVPAALAPVLGWLDGGPGSDGDPGGGPGAGQPDRPVLATAVRVSLRTFARIHPGRAVEVRVPPFAAVQCLEGQTHTRGTPPHVVQTDPRTWLELVTGRTTWAAALAAGRVQASGHRAGEVGALLPMPLSR